MGARLARLLEKEQTTVETNPHDVDEVPVVGDSLHSRELAWVATFVTPHTTQQEHHGDESDEHVEAVEARHDVEERAVRVRVPTSRAEQPLVDLVAQERHAQDDREDDP